MHPRNPYKDRLDFVALAQDYPPLKPCLVSGAHGTTIDFKSEVAQRHLTSALLHRDFSLTISLPEDRLCPPVPNRLNYVLWLQDIVSYCRSESVGQVWGIDIGTGASAIYPLLACKLERNWNFVATDIDLHSIGRAKSNVTANGLQSRVHIAQASLEADILFPLDPRFNNGNPAVFDFTMCNPPFYSSREEVEKSAKAKQLAPNAVCTGADVEMITAGGESGFVRRMVQESLEYRERCRWYTSMLGKMSSVSEVAELLQQNKIDHYAITEFIQGQTRRWAIGWSFGDQRLPDEISRIANPALQPIMPPRNTFRQSVPHSAKEIFTKLIRALESISIGERNILRKGTSEIVVQVYSNTWTRSARRKKASSMETEETNTIPVLECRANCAEGELELRWTRGRDRGLFESFSSHIFRKLVS